MANNPDVWPAKTPIHGPSSANGGQAFNDQVATTNMQIIKILSGVVCFVLATLSLLMVGLIALAWMAQYSNRAAGSSITACTIMIGPWTLSGWQIYAVASVFGMLIFAFIFCGLYLFKSPKPDA